MLQEVRSGIEGATTEASVRRWTSDPLDALSRTLGQRLDERALDAPLRNAAAIDQGRQRSFQRPRIAYALPDVCQ